MTIHWEIRYDRDQQSCLISNLMHKILIYLHIIHLLKSSTCFELYSDHLQEVYAVIVYMQPLVSSLSAGDCLVHRLRKNRCTRQSPAESDDARGCIYIQLRCRPPEVGIVTLCRWLSSAPVTKEFFLNRCTRQSPAESDDTRGCIYTIMT